MTYPIPSYSDTLKIRRIVRKMSAKSDLCDLFYEGNLVKGYIGVKSGIAYSRARMMYRNGCGGKFEISEHGSNLKRKINFKKQ